MGQKSVKSSVLSLLSRHYLDKTAHDAISNIQCEEKAADKKQCHLVKTLSRCIPIRQR